VTSSYAVNSHPSIIKLCTELLVNYPDIVTEPGLNVCLLHQICIKLQRSALFPFLVTSVPIDNAMLRPGKH